MSSIIGQQCPTFKTLTFSLYTLHRPQLYVVDSLLIIQQTFQVSPTIASVLSLVKKSLSNPLGEKILTTRFTNPISEPTELLKGLLHKTFSNM